MKGKGESMMIATWKGIALFAGMLFVTALACKARQETKGGGEAASGSGEKTGGALASEQVAQEEHPRVRMKTTLGDVVLELDRKNAPMSVENFLRYAQDGFYNGTIFHRVIQGFMVQGGGLEPGMKIKPARDPIRNEAGNGLKNLRGTAAMARTSVVDSATCQFFINVKDNAFLDHRDDTAQGYGYAVFGRVVEGMDVVEKIEKVQTGSRGPNRDVPIEDVFILKAEPESGKTLSP
jgi:cyclophilin family peptidyl-prolyl cis-trans isomerase